MIITNDWQDILKDEFNKDYFIKLKAFIDNEYQNEEIFPPYNLIFNALNITTYHNTKVVILGQDPYHDYNQACGLAFSVNKGIKIPPSLKNIYKELHNDLKINIPPHGDLSYWAMQGVLLLNTTLSVKAHKANSHAKIGWDKFTDAIIKKLNDSSNNIVFILWGNNAKSKTKLITNPNHLILEAPHPSPLSAHHGFFGCKHFSKTNEFLISHNIKAIDWQIE